MAGVINAWYRLTCRHCHIAVVTDAVKMFHGKLSLRTDKHPVGELFIEASVAITSREKRSSYEGFLGNNEESIIKVCWFDPAIP